MRLLSVLLTDNLLPEHISRVWVKDGEQIRCVQVKSLESSLQFDLDPKAVCSSVCQELSQPEPKELTTSEIVARTFSLVFNIAFVIFASLCFWLWSNCGTPVHAQEYDPIFRSWKADFGVYAAFYICPVCLQLLGVLLGSIHFFSVSIAWLCNMTMYARFLAFIVYTLVGVFSSNPVGIAEWPYHAQVVAIASVAGFSISSIPLVKGLYGPSPFANVVGFVLLPPGVDSSEFWAFTFVSPLAGFVVVSFLLSLLARYNVMDDAVFASSEYLEPSTRFAFGYGILPNALALLFICLPEYFGHSLGLVTLRAMAFPLSLVLDHVFARLPVWLRVMKGELMLGAHTDVTKKRVPYLGGRRTKF